MKRKALLFVLLSFCIFSLVGCETFSKKTDTTVQEKLLEPTIMTRFSDIPVPTGFKFISKESYSFESGGVRVGVLKYRGKAPIDQVTGFFKEQMPMYNWRLLNMVEYNQRLLNFERENESCIITLMPDGSAVTITASLGPKTQFPKKVDRPVK